MSQQSIRLNPANRPATWDQIKSKRNEIRESPITLADGRTFDADKDSFNLLEDAISEFNALDPIDLDLNGNLPWKMSNNEYTSCSQQDLSEVLSELRTKRARRAARLQKRAEVLNLETVTIGELDDLSKWGL